MFLERNLIISSNFTLICPVFNVTTKFDFVYAENKQMTYNDGVFAGDLLWYPEGNDKSQIVAYYPYKEGNTPASFTVETDQTSGYGASDFMAAKKSDVLP